MSKEELTITEEEMKEIIKRLDSEDMEDLLQEEEHSSYEEAMGELAVIEEENRIERMNSEDYVVPKEVTKSSTYKEGMEVAHLIISMTREMVHAGIDYANALQIASNFYMQKKAIEMQTLANSSSL